MLTSDYLDVLPNSVLDIYERFQQSVINDIARRLSTMAYASAAWQVQRLSESGMVYDNILEQLSEITGQSEAELKNIFAKAGVKSTTFDNAIYIKAGLQPVPLNLSPAMRNVLTVGLQRTNNLLKNLTLTTAITGQNAFIDAADLAYTQVVTGTMSYTQAIKEAVSKLADDGLSVINYSSGRQDRLDVAVRRTVLTGVNQTCGQLTEQQMDDMGVDLVQTSAHLGARNKGDVPENHEMWQGKIFSRTGQGYPNFYDITGYGTVTGLYGVNCVLGETLVSGFEECSAYRRKYTGEIIIIRTSSGKELSITPNHPILTDKGWIAAGLLNKGDNVISRATLNRINGISPNINQNEPSIKNIFDSLSINGNVFRLPSSAGYFHGDISDSEVDIVFPNRFLRNCYNASFFQKIKQFFFSNTAESSGFLFPKSAFTKIFISSFHATHSIMGRFCKFISLSLSHPFEALTHSIRLTFSKWYTKIREIFSYCAFGNSSFCSNFIFPHAGFIHSEKFIWCDSSHAPQVKFPIHFADSITSNAVTNGIKRTSVFISDKLHGLAGKVQLDNIVFIERKYLSSTHVYNLETKNGWYFANGIITHNCRHSAFPFFEGISQNAYDKEALKEYADETATYNGHEMSYYEATQKQRYFERGIRKWKRQASALEAAGQDNGAELAKVREWQARLRDFISQTDLYRQREREQI